MAKKKKSEDKAEFSYLSLINGANDFAGCAPVAPTNTTYKQSLSFGNLGLDLISGGGAPPRRISDIFGWQGSGKTTQLYYQVADAQKKGIPIIAVFDHEASFDYTYAAALGCDLTNLAVIKDGKVSQFEEGSILLFQNDTGEQTYRWMFNVLDSLPDVPQDAPLQCAFFIDSIKTMLTEVLEQDPDNAQKGREAAMHSKWLPFIKTRLSRKGAILSVTNQMRVNPMQMFGRKDSESAASAWKFFPDFKMEFRAVGKVEDGMGTSMRDTKCKTIKNKVFRPYQELVAKVGFGLGFTMPHQIHDYLYRTGQLFTTLNKNGNATKEYQIVFRDDFSGVEDHERGEMFQRTQGGKSGAMALVQENIPYLYERCRLQLDEGVAFDFYLNPFEESCKGCVHFMACQAKGARLSEFEPRCPEYTTAKEAADRTIENIPEPTASDVEAMAQQLLKEHADAVERCDTESIKRIEAELDAITKEIPLDTVL